MAKGYPCQSKSYSFIWMTCLAKMPPSIFIKMKSLSLYPTHSEEKSLGADDRESLLNDFQVT